MRIMHIALVAVLFATSCNLPDPGDINLSGCLRGCKVETELCVDDALLFTEACEDTDRECLDDGSRLFSACLTDALDCAAACAEEAEDALK